MADDIVIIKKYANRRLYNTETSAYITLDDLAEMVKEGRVFEVVDAKSGEDLTRATLAQIIFEGETKGEALLPVSFMRQIIGLYGNAMNQLLPPYLDIMMETFRKNQEKVSEQGAQMMGGFNPAGAMETMQKFQKQQMDAMQNMVKMWNPYAAAMGEDSEKEALKKRVAELEEQLNKKSS